MERFATLLRILILGPQHWLGWPMRAGDEIDATDRIVGPKNPNEEFSRVLRGPDGNKRDSF